MARDKQVSFSPLQTHVKMFEWGMIAFCILCIVLGVLIAKATEWGITTRP